MYFTSLCSSPFTREHILSSSHSFSDGIRQNENGATDNDDVPPDSNLTIKLKLVSWKSVIDVTGDKKVLKRITKVGEGFDRPNEGSVVKGNHMIKRILVCQSHLFIEFSNVDKT